MSSRMRGVYFPMAKPLSNTFASARVALEEVFIQIVISHRVMNFDWSICGEVFANGFTTPHCKSQLKRPRKDVQLSRRLDMCMLSTPVGLRLDEKDEDRTLFDTCLPTK
jgi:hypothetical protein